MTPEQEVFVKRIALDIATARGEPSTAWAESAIEHLLQDSMTPKPLEQLKQFQIKVEPREDEQP